MKAVMAATEKWRDTVTLNTDDAPKKTAALYAPDALFWGTVSEQVRDTPAHVYQYFVSNIHVVFHEETCNENGFNRFLCRNRLLD